MFQLLLQDRMIRISGGIKDKDLIITVSGILTMESLNVRSVKGLGILLHSVVFGLKEKFMVPI